MSVLDRTGTPILDLNARDFEVNEGGRRREVTRAALGGGLRSRIAVLVDNGFLAGSTINPVRAALERLVTGVPADDEIVLGTISPQFRVQVKPTADRRELLSGIGRLFAATTTGTALVDGLLEIDDRFVKTARDRWPVFVIVTSDSPEVSGAQIEDFNRRVQELTLRGARTYAIVVSYNSRARGNEQEMCMVLTQTTGGTYESVNSLTSLPEKLTNVAADIVHARERAAGEYLIEFARESDAAQLDVAVSIPGVTIRVSLAP